MDKKALIIGFGYKARNGKDTCVREIIDKFGAQYYIKQFSFANALKRGVEAQGDLFELCMLYGVKYDPNPDMTDPMCQSRHGKQSALLQYYGQLKRNEDPFYWVKVVRDEIVESKVDIALISDMRMKNEFVFVKANKGYTVKVTRHGFVDLTRDPNHISEIDLDGVKFDIQIDVKDGELAQLKLDAITAFRFILENENPNSDLGEIPHVQLKQEQVASLN